MSTLSYIKFASAIIVAGAMSAASAAEPVKAVKGSLFNPSDFTSLGRCVPAVRQTVTFDTGSSNREPSVSGAISGKGAIGVCEGGKVQVAVFAFDEILLRDSITVTVTGERGIVLLAKGPIGVETRISVSGADGTTKPGAAGGTAPGGPGSAGGQPIPAGCGASHGGAGGDSSAAAWGTRKVPTSLPKRPTHGDPAVTALVGGHGGAGAGDAAGGGGGGSIAVISLAKVSLVNAGAITADGGAGGQSKMAGGGGSGGSVVIAAPVLSFRGSGVSAKGGAGGSGGPGVEMEILAGTSPRQAGSGGGGGGGRIAYYTTEDIGVKGKDQVEPIGPPYYGGDVDGGDGGFQAVDGDNGTIYDGTWPNLK